MVLKWNKKVIEERVWPVIENRLENMSVVGNEVLQCRKEILEKYFSEAIKSKYSNNHC